MKIKICFLVEYKDEKAILSSIKKVDDFMFTIACRDDLTAKDSKMISVVLGTLVFQADGYRFPFDFLNADKEPVTVYVTRFNIM